MSDCTRIRSELSAARDGEHLAGDDVRRHVDACPPCTAWVSGLDRLTVRLRVDAVATPDVLPAALAAWDAATDRPARLLGRRAVLAVAGAACLLVGAAHLTGTGPVAAADPHSGRELGALDAALGAAFLLATWRPRRFVPGLAPLAALLALLLVVVATLDVLNGHATLLGEVVHLPAVVGALALVHLARVTGEPDPPERLAHRRTREEVAA